MFQPNDVEEFWCGDFSCLCFIPFEDNDLGRVYSDETFLYHIRNCRDNKSDKCDFFDTVKKANLPEKIVNKIEQIIKEVDVVEETW